MCATAAGLISLSAKGRTSIPAGGHVFLRDTALIYNISIAPSIAAVSGLAV